jgi:hypothetical protein
MRFRPASTRRARILPALAAIAALALAGCGKGSEATGGGGGGRGGPVASVAPVAAEGAVTVTTRNTTRVGGSDPVVDAAAVARVVYPGLTPGSRPQAVVLVDRHDWPAALAASPLAGAPLNAPILYAEGNSLPAVSREALEAMHPRGAAAVGGAQVIRVGTEAGLPAGYVARSLPRTDPVGIAGEVEQILAKAAGRTPREAIVLGVEGARSMQMPAPGLAAESAVPLLPVAGGELPPAAQTLLRSMHKPAIYVMNAARLSRGAIGALARLGTVTRIPESEGGEAATPAGSSIAAARFTDGTFGWGVKEPGHGLVFARSSRPLDAPGAALLSATGDYGPMLLLESAERIPPQLVAYLGDIQPAYTSEPEFRPVRGVYNHGWLIGDEAAISLGTQAELDSLLEISPRKQGAAEETSVLQSE